MTVLDRKDMAVVNAVFRDLIDNEHAEVVLLDETAAVITVDGWTKCVFAYPETGAEILESLGVNGNICYMNMREETAGKLGIAASPCRTYAYLNAMPPAFDSALVVKRLAPTLAGEVLKHYDNPGGGYDENAVAELMRSKGIFGAICGGKLAGFIGRHGDGSMGMLEVYEDFRRRGLGEQLEIFMINYVMTFGRTPHCDVYTDNIASQRLQEKLGLTPTPFYTYWQA